MQAGGCEDYTVCEREFEVDAKSGGLEGKIAIEIDNQTLPHLSDYVECGLFSRLAQHSLEDFEKADRRNYQLFDGENGGLKRVCIRTTVDVFEPA